MQDKWLYKSSVVVLRVRWLDVSKILWQSVSCLFIEDWISVQQRLSCSVILSGIFDSLYSNNLILSSTFC